VAVTKDTVVADPSQVGGSELTPIFANRFYVLVTPSVTRVAFGEFVAGDPDSDTNFHTAMVMPTPQALQLANLILELHQKNIARSRNSTDTRDGP
jgi:hypothetical protein